VRRSLQKPRIARPQGGLRGGGLCLEPPLPACPSPAASPSQDRSAPRGVWHTARAPSPPLPRLELSPPPLPPPPLSISSMHSPSRTCVSFHLTLPLAATGGGDGCVRLFDADARQPTLTLRGCNGRVRRVLLHPTRPLVMAGGEDGAPRLWGTEQGEEIAAYQKVHAGEVRTTREGLKGEGGNGVTGGGEEVEGQEHCRSKRAERKGHTGKRGRGEEGRRG
jgi:WD40 repeat protein